MFIKYPHLVKWNTDETAGLENGQDYIYIFPKLDGTNASLWYNASNGQVEGGSRRRQLSLEDDNRGFLNRICNSEEFDFIHKLLSNYKNWIFYGEWLVKHTLATYLPHAWEKFYVFDVFDRETGLFVPYEEYRHVVAVLTQIDDVFQLVPPLAVAKKLDDENIKRLLSENYYMMQEGELGEGIVIKRYGFVNRYGEIAWGKVVRSEFKAKHVATMGPTVINAKDSLEEKIVSQYVSEHLIMKTMAKVLCEQGHDPEGGLPSRLIPEVLGRVWYDLIQEEIWTILKKFQNPQINFKQLNKLVYAKTKTVIGI